MIDGFQYNPQWVPLLAFMPLCNPLSHYTRIGLCDHGSGGIGLLKLSYKRHCNFCLGLFLTLFFSLGLITLGEVIFYVMSSPMERPMWQVTEASRQQPVRNSSLCPQPCEWTLMHVLLLSLCLQMTLILLTILRRDPESEPPVKLLPQFRFSEIVWDSKCLWF